MFLLPLPEQALLLLGSMQVPDQHCALTTTVNEAVQQGSGGAQEGVRRPPPH
jgi:hypothetical protein